MCTRVPDPLSGGPSTGTQQLSAFTIDRRYSPHSFTPVSCHASRRVPTRSHAPHPDLLAPSYPVLPRPVPCYLRTLSFRWNYYFGEFEPFGYHLVNVLLHCCVAVVVAQACAVVFRG